MNFENFYDITRTLTNLEVGVAGDENRYSVLFPYIAENRKVHLIVETDDVVFEGTRMEMETKRVTVLNNPNVMLLSKEHEKALSAIMSEDKITLTKIGCQEIEVDKSVHQKMKAIVATNLSEMNKKLMAVIISTSAYLNLNSQQTMSLLMNDTTYFGKINGVRKAIINNSIKYKDIENGMCNKADVNRFFEEYISAMENYYYSLSAINLCRT